jgi:hypothetical protein
MVLSTWFFITTNLYSIMIIDWVCKIIFHLTNPNINGIIFKILLITYDIVLYLKKIINGNIKDLIELVIKMFFNW